MSATRLLEIADASGDRLQRAWTLATRDSPLRAYDMALAVHEEARRQGDHQMLAASADCLAECCIRTARSELGIEFARTAHAIWAARGDDIRAAGALSRQAEMLADIGEPDAVAQAELALAVAERSGNPTEMVRALMTNGIVLSLLREPDQALPFSQRSVELCDRWGIVFPVALINLAEVGVLCGLHDKQAGDAEALQPRVKRALTLTRAARAAARECADGWLERLALNNIGEYSMYVGDTATAAAAAAEFASVAGEPTERCRSHHLLIRGQILAAEGRLDAAVAAFVECQEALQHTDWLASVVLCLQGLAEAQERLGRYREALATHRAFHARFVQKASEGAQRRARVYARRHETAQLQQEARELAASNQSLAREAEHLRRISLEDSLTKLPNRRRLEMAFLDLHASGAPFALAMLDIDHFKQVNDRYSHAVGDEVLRHVGRLLADQIRQDDLAARFGGEEFAVLMCGASMAQAREVCERLRLAVQGHEWESVQAGLTLTVSVGVALSTEAVDYTAVLDVADSRLYAAKRGGRNQVLPA